MKRIRVGLGGERTSPPSAVALVFLLCGVYSLVLTLIRDHLTIFAE